MQSFTDGKLRHRSGILGRICGRRSDRDRRWIGRKRAPCEAKRGNEGLYGKDTRKVVIVLCGDFSGNAVDNRTEGNTNPTDHFFKHESKEHQSNVGLNGKKA